MVALCAAAVHAYTWWLRRSEAAHLWLAVSALGIVGIGITIAGVYEAADIREAEMWQRLMITAGAPTLLGFHLFTRALLDLGPARVDRFVYAILALMVGQTLWPELVFGGEEIERRIGPHAQIYLAREFSPFGSMLIAGFSAIYAVVIRQWVRHRSKFRDNRKLLIAAMAGLFASGINDMLVGMRFYDAPLTIIFGYAGFLVVFSAILVQRFVHSMDDVERSAEDLHELVERRTEELRQKDVQLAHGEQMATIGTLAAGIAHEINNPIAFVSSNLNQLETLWDKPEDAEEVPEILSECREGVDRVRAIVADLLSMARRSDGHDERVDLRSVVESALPILQREARFRARLETRLDPVPPVAGDARLLGQIVLNLTLNALQAIAEGDPENNAVHVSTAHEDGSVWLLVRDTGPGIPEDVQPHIFDPFFTTKARGEGTGLGLAVTHQLVTRHRGRIEVETGPGGTTMAVELPPVSQDAATPAQET